MKDVDITRSFIKEEDITKIINDFNNSRALELVDLPAMALGTFEKKSRLKISLKLKIAFQRQVQLDFDEAYKYYGANISILNERILLLYDIIDKLNEIGVAYIPDKLTVCSYMRVSADTFDKLLTDAQVDTECQKGFNELNEFILSSTQIGLESGMLNNYAYHRLRLKAKFGGQEIEEHETKKEATPIVINAQIKRKLASDYDFNKLISSDSTNDDEAK